MTLQLKSIDQEKQVALFENSEELFSVYYVLNIYGNVMGIDREHEKDRDEIIKIIQDHIDASPKAEQLEQAVREAVGEIYSTYKIDVSDLSIMDIYELHNRFKIEDHSGCIQHASKKLLLSGKRTGGKSKHDDIKEARDTLNRWLDINTA